MQRSNHKKLYRCSDLLGILVGLLVGCIIASYFFGYDPAFSIIFAFFLYVVISIRYALVNDNLFSSFFREIKEQSDNLSEMLEESKYKKSDKDIRIELLEKTLKEAEIDYRGMEGYCEKLIAEDDKFQEVRGQSKELDLVHDQSMKLANNLMIECKCTADYLKAIVEGDMELAKLIDRATSK